MEEIWQALHDLALASIWRWAMLTLVMPRWAERRWAILPVSSQTGRRDRTKDPRVAIPDSPLPLCSWSHTAAPLASSKLNFLVEVGGDKPNAIGTWRSLRPKTCSRSGRVAGD